MAALAAADVCVSFPPLPALSPARSSMREDPNPDKPASEKMFLVRHHTRGPVRAVAAAAASSIARCCSGTKHGDQLSQASAFSGAPVELR